MSNPETISGLRVDESTNCLKHIAGLKFAKSFNSFLISKELFLVF